MDAHPFEPIEHVYFNETLIIERIIEHDYVDAANGNNIVIEGMVIKLDEPYNTIKLRGVLSLYTSSYNYFGSITAPIKRRRKRIKKDMGEERYVLHIECVEEGTIKTDILENALEIAGYINAVTSYYTQHRAEYWTIKIRSGDLPTSYRIIFKNNETMFETYHVVAYSNALKCLLRLQKSTTQPKAQNPKEPHKMNVLSIYDTGVKKSLLNSLSAQDGEYLYIGRESRKLGLTQSPLANPFPITKHSNREEVVKKYRAWLYRKMLNEDQVILSHLLYMPDDTNLVCYCAPKSCHGYVLVSAAEHVKRNYITCFTCNIANYNMDNFTYRQGYIHHKDKKECFPCYCDETSGLNTYCDACLSGYADHIDTGVMCVCTTFYGPCRVCNEEDAVEPDQETYDHAIEHENAVSCNSQYCECGIQEPCYLRCAHLGK